MKCPVDNATLLITDRSGIEIDYCPECRGVWLDRGELDKLIEGASRSESRYDTREDDRRHEERRNHNDDDRDRHDTRRGEDRHKKRESFLGDIFEF